MFDYISAAAVVAGAVLTVLGIQAVLQRAISSGGAHPVADTVMEPLAGIYGLLLAFTLTATADRLAGMRSAVREEQLSAAHLYQIAERLPEPAGREVRDSLEHLLRPAPPGASNELRRERFERGLQGLWSVVARFEAKNEHQTLLQGEALTELRTLRAQHALVSMAAPSHPLIWWILVSGGLCIVAVCVVAGTADPHCRFYVAVLTALITFTLYSLFVFSRPLTHQAPPALVQTVPPF